MVKLYEGPHREGREIFLNLASILFWASSFSIVFEFPFCEECRISFGVLVKKTTEWVAYKQQQFIVHSCGGWEVLRPKSP